MEQDVQYALSVYGMILWLWVFFLSTLIWWSQRPGARGKPRFTVARTALLLALFGVPLMHDSLSIDAQLALLAGLLGCAAVLWMAGGRWPVYLFLGCAGVAFLRDGMVLDSILQIPKSLDDLVTLLAFKAVPSVDSVFDLFVGPVIYASLIVLLFRLALFAVGAWAALKYLQAVGKERQEEEDG